MHRTSGRVLVVVAAFMLLLVPVGAIAVSQTFADVPPTDWAFNDIEWLATAGVTQGCGDGTNYCPDTFVTRRQMAAFMHRLGTNQVVDAATVGGMTAAQLKLGFYTKDTHTAAYTTGYYSGDAWCDSGDVAVGGGVQLHANSQDFALMESIPTHVGTELPSGWSPTGWHGEVWLGKDLGGGLWAFRTWVVCANTTP